MKFIEIDIASIHIGSRHRKAVGDIAALAASISEIGLLHPIVLRTDKQLVAGFRRIEAYRKLDCPKIPAVIVQTLDEALAALKAERDENVCREDFAPSEAVALGRAIEEFEGPRAKERAEQGRKLGGQTAGKGRSKTDSSVANCHQAKTRTLAAAGTGMSPRTYDKAKAVVVAAESEPKRFASVVEEMDRTGNVDRAHRQLQSARRVDEERKAIQEVPAKGWDITESESNVECSALITDPPYGIIDQPWEPKQLESFTREWLVRWNGCGANIVAAFWSQRYLWDGRRWFDESLTHYAFQQLLIWHYPNNKSPQSRQGLKQTWEPIFLYRRKGFTAPLVIAGETWGDGLNDFDCHVAAVPQSNFNSQDAKQHPAQKPVSVMRWLVNVLSRPGDLIADPFCGSGTTGIAAVQLGRRFHGVEIDKTFRTLAQGRIARYGTTIV